MFFGARLESLTWGRQFRERRWKGSRDADDRASESSCRFAVPSCAASGPACNTPLGAVPPTTPLFNFPVSLQTSITAGLRYELNDSAALKIEYSVVDVERDASEIASANNPFGINFGLFDTSFTNPSPTDDVGITSIALDVIF